MSVLNVLDLSTPFKNRGHSDLEGGLALNVAPPIERNLYYTTGAALTKTLNETESNIQASDHQSCNLS